jgi:hypothetical protein
MLLPVPLSLTAGAAHCECENLTAAPPSLNGERQFTARIWDLLIWFSINGTWDRRGHCRRLDDCGMWW